MTKHAAIAAALVLIALVGGTAIYTTFLASNDRMACGISSAVGADVGGPFELVDVTGKAVTEAEVLARPALVYFGYTYCPDVCPLDVARNALAIDLMKENGVDVGLVFITVDPARDTPNVLAAYAEAMHPDMIALTGTEPQIATVASAYRAYYERGEGEGDFYLMDHTTHTYLMLPGGRFGGVFGREETAEAIAEKSACLIRRL